MGENALQGLRLSEAGKRCRDEHPRRAHRIASEAIEADARREAGMDEIPETPRPSARERADGREIVSLREASRRLSVTRTRLYDWVRMRRLLAWKTSKRGPKLPAEQILEPERFVDGVDQLRAILVDPELVWVFLSEEPPSRMKWRGRSTS
jgi:hypothetical protein